MCLSGTGKARASRSPNAVSAPRAGAWGLGGRTVGGDLAQQRLDVGERPALLFRAVFDDSRPQATEQAEHVVSPWSRVGRSPRALFARATDRVVCAAAHGAALTMSWPGFQATSMPPVSPAYLRSPKSRNS